jgi:hypothetical protein
MKSIKSNTLRKGRLGRFYQEPSSSPLFFIFLFYLSNFSSSSKNRNRVDLISRFAVLEVSSFNDSSSFELELKGGSFDCRMASCILISVMLVKRRYLVKRLSPKGLVDHDSKSPSTSLSVRRGVVAHSTY